MQNQDTIRQHFIPCCYLKFFCKDGTWEKGRKTLIYFTDGATSNVASVDKLGVDKYTYSKANPEFDKQFNVVENDYPVLIERILGGERKFTTGEYYRLLMIMVDFNLRNVAYENRTEGERMHAYEKISRRFNYDLFSETEGQGTDMPEMLKHLTDNWHVKIIGSETAEKFITSDNPSTIYVNPEHGRPVMIYLPIHPDFALVAYDRRDLETTSANASDDTLGVLNGLQINRCVRHTFSDHDLQGQPEEWKKIQGLAKRQKPERWVDGVGWKPDFIEIGGASFERFNFIRSI